MMTTESTRDSLIRTLADSIGTAGEQAARLILADHIDELDGGTNISAALRELGRPVTVNDGIVAPMPAWTVLMREECGGCEHTTIYAADLDTAREMAEEETCDWIREGDYGISGAEVSGYWELQDADGETLLDDDGDEVNGRVSVDIDPDHDALIAAAGGDTDCDHDWTSEGEGGCRENPGVWSGGGTTMIYCSHCRVCGLRRREVHYGCQRNPGQVDEVEYAMPDDE